MTRTYFRHMRYRVMWMALLIAGCGGTPEDPCQRFFEPYPDIVSGRLRTSHNAILLDAMAEYGRANYALAIPGLTAFARANPQEADIAYLYLACCYLATGEPFQAELQLDFLERWQGRTFRDEIDRYNVLCMVCSGQNDRALEMARAIVSAPKHAYREEALEIVSALEQ